MTIRAKSVVFKRDGEYTVFSKVYDVEKTEDPFHSDLLLKASKKGFKDEHFVAISTSTWDPYTIEIYPELTQKIATKVKNLVKEDIIRILNIQKCKKILDTFNPDLHR